MVISKDRGEIEYSFLDGTFLTFFYTSNFMVIWVWFEVKKLAPNYYGIMDRQWHTRPDFFEKRVK